MPGAVVGTFVEATVNVLAIMADVGVTVQAADDGAAGRRTSDVSAIVGFGGELAGGLVLALPQATAGRLAEAFAGQPVGTEGDEDFVDAVGELANMIAGGAKKQLHTLTGRRAVLTTPTVILGGHCVARPTGTPRVTLPCTSAAGPFSLEVSVSETGSIEPGSTDAAR